MCRTTSCPPHQTCVTPDPTQETEDDTPEPTPITPEPTEETEEDTPTPVTPEPEDDDDDPTPRPTPCRTGGGGGLKSTSRCPTLVPTPTRTHTPTPTPRCALSVVRVAEDSDRGGNISIDSDSLDWTVLTRRYVKVNVTVNDGFNLDNYEFNLLFNSDETGFYIEHWTGTCRPLGRTESGWIEASDKLYMIRCSVGDGATGFELRVRRESDEVVIQRGIWTGDIQQAQHRHESETTYYTDLTASWGSRPDYVAARYTELYRQMLPEAMKIAADLWNSTRATPFLVPHTGGGVPGITAYGYWEGGSDCGSGAKIHACMKHRIAPLPHIFNSSVPVKFPPEPPDSKGRVVHWTNTIDDALFIDPSRGVLDFYLPDVLMHEMAHAMGVGHDLLDPDSLMTRYSEEAIGYPSSHDRIGLNAVLDAH